MSRIHASFTVFLFSFLICSIAFSQTSQGSGPVGRGGSFTPDIGANALFLYQNSNRGNEQWSADRNGASLQEAELQFASDVDPYWRFVSTFAMSQKVTVDKTTNPPTRTADFIFEPEELYVDSLELPGVSLRLGKFKAALGKHNGLHTHAFPFVDAPLQNSVLLGDEGLNDVGVSAAAMIPVSWFSEFTLQGFSGHADSLTYFNGRSANDSVIVGHLTNLWDLTDEATFNVGLSAATGQNKTASSTNIYGVDLTYKWRADKTRGFIWSTEFLSRELNQATKEMGRGFASWVQYQIAERWWVQARGEYLEVKDQDPAAVDPIPTYQRKQTALVGYIPSEFSGLRLQFDELNDGAAKPEKKIMLQFNFTIGAHPAHSY
jgi:hypothetical protein